MRRIRGLLAIGGAVLRDRGGVLATLLVTLLVAGQAAADDAADAAAEVVAALAKGDKAKLEVLARRRDPDAWIVADQLCAEGKHDAAAAFAAVVPQADGEDLPAYVARLRSQPGDATARDAFRRAAGSNKAEVILEGLEGLPTRDDDVLAFRIHFRRAGALDNRRRVDESAAAYRQAAALAARLRWPRGEAEALRRLGILLVRAGDAQGALAPLGDSARIFLARKDGGEAAGALMERASAYRGLARFPEAIADLERARALKEEARDLGSVARIVGNLGNVYANMGDYPRALALQREALERKRSLGDPVLTSTLDNIGSLLALMGEYDEALRYKTEALAQARVQENQLDVARILANMAVVHDVLGEHAKALSLLNEATGLQRAHKDARGEALTAASLAKTYLALGDVVRSREWSDWALALMRSIGDPRGEATALLSLGNTLLRTGDAEAAATHFDRALVLYRDIGDRAGMATAGMSLALVRKERRDLDGALKLALESLAMKRDLKDRAGAALAQVNVGEIRLLRGERREAKEVLEAALAEALAVDDAETVRYALLAVAHVHLAEGAAEEAITAARRAVATAARAVRGLGDEQGAAARTSVAMICAFGAEAALAADDAEDLAFFLESGRAGALLESLQGRERLRTQAVPPLLRETEAEREAARRIAAYHYRRAVEEGDRAAIRASREALDRAEAMMVSVTETIQREAKIAADVLYPSAAPLADIRAELGAKEALILYGSGETTSCALVVTPGAARIVRLGDAARLRATSQAIEGIGDPRSDRAAAVAELRKLLAAPLELPKGTARVLVSPDADLAHLPWALLFDAEVACVPSGTTYRLLREERAARGEGVLALGDPATGGDLARLPSARGEAKAVGDVVLLDESATKAGLATAIAGRPRWRAVHLACHGIVDRERPMLSALALAADGDDDGRLETMGIFRLRIPTDLVTLSACETARGKAYRGEGVLGFTRAFMFAGSPRVLVSLWKVDDEATRALMEAFYAAWNPRDGSKGIPAAAALRKAQEKVKAEARWRHPAYWAAWQLWGLPE